MSSAISGISSMATRRVPLEIVGQYQATTGERAAIEAIGGVDAARRVRAGDVFDLVVLADDVIEALEREGHIVAGSCVGFVRSAMAIAVGAGAPRPEIGDEACARATLTSARSVGYSTGPSGTHLLGVLKSWGLDTADKARFGEAKPGIPVAKLVAEGEAEIGVQQLSEFLDEPGVDIVGLAPPPVQSVTTFSIGLSSRTPLPEEARALLAYLVGAETAEIKRRLGMEPA